jgi:DNA polymerase-3 subunit delta'
LFTGIAGIGKSAAATTFAMACNCLAAGTEASSRTTARVEPCSQCRACKKIRSGTHPDVITIAPEKSAIRIDRVRELLQTLVLKPYEARRRVVIVVDAQCMTPEAANAILKVLEEPPDHTMLILVAPGASDLLPTVVSRCQNVRFHPISVQQLTQMLIDRQIAAPAAARSLAAAAEGSYAKAVELARSGWAQRRRWLMNQLACIGRQTTGVLLAFAEVLAKDKDRLTDAFEIMKSQLRDVAVYPLAPERIIHQDLREQIAQMARRRSGLSIFRDVACIAAVQEQIRRNANARLAVEAMVLEMARNDRPSAQRREERNR